VSVLASALEGDAALAERAAVVLGEMGPKAKAAIPQLKTALKAKPARVRITSAEALYQVSRDASDSLPVLEELLKSKEAGDRLFAVSSLGSLGAESKVADLLVGLLESKDVATRREAACALAERGVVLEKAASALEAGLHDADVGVRWWCAVALAGSDLNLRKQEEDLLRAFHAALWKMGDREPWKTIQVVQGPASARAAAALSVVLKSRPARLRLEAARALGGLGLDSRTAQPALVEALKDPEKLVRRAAAEALGQMGTEAIPLLVRLLGTENERAREGAARALGQMGLAARSTVPALLRLKKDGSSAVRTQAALALWFIDQDAGQALDILRLVIADIDNKDRWEAVESAGIILVQTRTQIRGLLPLIVKALKDRDVSVRIHAAKWLFRREHQAKVVVPLLRDGVSDRNAFGRLNSVEILGEMGAAARVVPLLTTALEDRDVAVRLAAEEALARAGRESISALLEALKSKKTKVVVGVVRALGLIGPEAKEALPALKGLKEKDRAARQAIEESIRAITAKTE
jgi:HEAT repeat protein